MPFDSTLFVCFQCANTASTEAVKNCSPGDDVKKGQNIQQESASSPPAKTAPPKQTEAPSKPSPSNQVSRQPKASENPSTPNDRPFESSSKKPKPSENPPLKTVESSSRDPTISKPSDDGGVSEESPVTNPSASETLDDPPCVSTEWIKNENLSKHVLRNGKQSKVLCIPGLPCATRGHVLRQCNSRKQCDLRTYQEVCEKRYDCTESTILVSQLSHSFDWSVYRSGNLQLTSLSMNSPAGMYSISRCVAQAAEIMIRNEMGSICNFVSNVSFHLNKVFKFAFFVHSQ